MTLLDTNALVWLLWDTERLGAAARHVCRSERVFFSPLSVVELVMKQMLGRFTAVADFGSAAAEAGLHELLFSVRHARAVVRFPELARHDPFDRMLLSQAHAEGFDFLTADRPLLAIGYDWVVDARV